MRNKFLRIYCQINLLTYGHKSFEFDSDFAINDSRLGHLSFQIKQKMTHLSLK